MKTLALLGTTLGLGVTSGLNLYATVFGLGLGIHLGWIHLAPGLEALVWLAHPVVLIVSGCMYCVEFLADKVPIVEQAWDLLHTFIRPLGAILIAWKAFGGSLGETSEIALILLTGGVSLATHAGKSGLRVASVATGGHAVGLGCLMSAVEDVVAFALAPMAVAHPLIALAFALIVLVLVAILAPAGFRFLRSRVKALQYAVRHKLTRSEEETLRRGEIPFRAIHALEEMGIKPEDCSAVFPACAIGIKGLPRWSSGYAAIDASGTAFVALGLFRTRTGSFRWRDGVSALSSTVFGYKLRYDTGQSRITVAFYPLTKAMARRLRELVPASGPARSAAPAATVLGGAQTSL